ncbi:hypothetical protein [Uliginosibacterium sediminicola]|uniref:Uncharacterized protein n=1 Tax=Uliginosibacterium sediminicola TaxID=2024550 RepID=A0ABU9YVY1_9RHOO
MQVDTKAAREFSEGGDRYTGAEVRLLVHNLCDEVDRLRAQLEAVGVRYVHASEVTGAQRLAVLGSPLYALGDAVLVWANQGDLCAVGLAMEPRHPSMEPFKCPICGSCYFGPLWEGAEYVGRFCKGWPSGWDRSYDPCRGKYEELFGRPNAEVRGRPHDTKQE